MTERRTPDQMAIVADRIPVAVRDQPPAAERAAVPLREPVHVHEEVAAVRLASLIAQGDLGAVHRDVHAMEHGLSPWVVNPWRLAEALAALLVRRAGQPQAVAETASPAGAGPPSVSPAQPAAETTSEAG